MQLKKVWSEEFRPKTFDEILGQTHMVSRLQNFVEAKEFPHMLLIGPNGAGKTTCVKVLMKSIFTPSERKFNVLWINGADNRGSYMVRNIVKSFCKNLSTTKEKLNFIIIESIEQVTSDAQRMIPYIMEYYSRNFRFIFTCTHKSRVLRHIKSHCVELSFSPLKESVIKAKLKEIGDLKRISIHDDVALRIARIAQGDLRKAFNFLQTAAVASNSSEITIDSVNFITEVIQMSEVKELLLSCFITDPDFKIVKKKLNQIMERYGLLGEELIEAFYLTLKQTSDQEITSKNRFRALSILADTEYHINEGCNPVIQFSGFVSKLISS